MRCGHAWQELPERGPPGILFELLGHQIVGTGHGGPKEAEETSIACPCQQHQNPSLQQLDRQQHSDETEEFDTSQD